jgi:phage gpG-like protein
MIRLTVRTQFDKRKLKKKAETATFTSIREAGGAIRKTASRSIRKRKKASKPGSPPNTQTGMLRRVIRYEVTSNKTEVIIGPVNEIAGRLWNLHEFGGVATKRRKLKPHRFRVGEHGPIRIKQQGNKTKFARIELRTAAQANRATRLVAEENERRSDNKPRHYPKRPFMKPALDANRSRLPMFWANSVK